MNSDKNDIAVAMRINVSRIGDSEGIPEGRFEFVSPVHEATLIRGWGLGWGIDGTAALS